jgi:stage V sporulation protein D (sporulation-specific penicillin-binding protein)
MGKQGAVGVVKARTMWVFVIMSLLFAGIAARLVYVQVIGNQRYVKYASSRLRTIPLQAKRGGIYDRNGKALAVDIAVISVFADLRHFPATPELIEDVSKVLGFNKDRIALKLKGRSSIVYLDKNVDPKYADAIDHKKMELRGVDYERNPDNKTISVYVDLDKVNTKRKLLDNVARLLGFDRDIIAQTIAGQKGKVYLNKEVAPKYASIIDNDKIFLHSHGIGYERRSRRVYPAGHLAAQLLGFTNIDNKGVEGIESRMDGILTGTGGKCVGEFDGNERMIPETRRVLKKPIDGKNVYLTIDITIQHIAERAMAAMAKKYTPEHAVAIVMDPDTGEVLALANYPTYDANNALKVPSTLWRNRAVSEIYEPGSTQKVFTLAAALNEGYSANTVFAYCTGKEKMKGGKIPCLLHHPYEHGHGASTMPMIIKESCNIGAAHVALKLGPERFFKYEEAFGMTKKLKAGFGGEAVGWVRRPDKIKPIELANNGFGQGLVITPMHMAAGYCVIANGGSFVQPQILREIHERDGITIEKFDRRVLRRVLSTETASKMTDMMVDCVKKGTGKPAGVAGRVVAGKTGSAQIAKTNGRGYEEGAFVSSFMGFAPARNARLVIAVAVFRPKGSHWGATVAAPVFREIAEKSLWYMKVPTEKTGAPTIKTKPGPAKMAALTR